MNRSTLILSVLLGLSVAANLLIAGIVLGHRFSDRPPPRHGGGIDKVLGAVPEDVRIDIREALRANRSSVREHLEELRDAHDAADRALRARPFDPVAAEAALSRLRTLAGEAQTRLHAVAVEAMARAQRDGTLPPPPERRRRPPRDREEFGPDGDRPPPPPGDR